MHDEWATPLMTTDDVLALPKEFQGKVSQALHIARFEIEAIKNSSVRFELGEMSKEQAAVLLSFIYVPVRCKMALLTWSNQHPALPQPRIWNFDNYYEALVKFSGLYLQNEKSA